MKRTFGAMIVLTAISLAEDEGEGWVTHAIALSPDLKTSVRGRMHAEKGTSRVRVHNAYTQELRLELKSSGPIRAIAFHGDGSRYVLTNDHGPLQVRNAKTGVVLTELAGHRGWVYAVAFAGAHVASAGRDDSLRVWNAETGKALWSKAGVKAARVALSPDGTRLATTDQFGKILLWDAATGEQQRTLDTGDNRWGMVVAFSRDGKVVAGGNRQVRAFDVETGKVLATLKVHDKRVTAIAFSGNGSRLATADIDKVVRLWRLSGAQAERTWTAKNGVGALEFSPKGDTLCAATHYGRCQFWDMSTGREMTEILSVKPKAKH